TRIVAPGAARFRVGRAFDLRRLRRDGGGHPRRWRGCVRETVAGTRSVAAQGRGRDHQPQKKATDSRAGMEASQRTSPYYRDWTAMVPGDLDAARSAVQTRDFEKLARV